MPSSNEYHQQYQAEQAAKAKLVGPLPDPEDAGRRNACVDDFRLFCETYFPVRFSMPWSNDHIRCIGRLQTATVDGGRFAFAMPRGSGKTSLSEAAALWGVLYGHRSFVVLLGSTEAAAAELLSSVKAELEGNDLLAADFPEACLPIRWLEGQVKKAVGQALKPHGTRTRIVWRDAEIVLPTVPGSASSGATIRTAGITGRIRGMKHTTAKGLVVRPDLVICDDPQTDESAASLTQNDKREQLLSGAVLGLAGPKVKIAAVMPCTVIAPRDMADRVLDRESHPEWNGERTKLIYSFPANTELWDRYAEIRNQSLREHGDIRDATEFYRANMAAMDKGAVVAWKERFKPDELSAVQSAMNLMLSDRRAFMAEYQNDPERADLGVGAKSLLPENLVSRLSGCERFVVPRECTRLTAFFDPGLAVIWYAVAAWTERFGGGVVDYGCWPRQARSAFAAADARPALADVEAYRGFTEDQLVFAGLRDLTAEVMGRVYFREGGGEAKVERGLVDSGWKTAAVYQFVRQSPYPLYPSKGIGRTMTARGVSEWAPRPGERSGHHWRLTVGEDRRGRSVQFDPDAWKTFLHSALTTPPGGPTGLSLFGRSAGAHEMVAAHCAAEYSAPVTIRGATFDKWAVRPDRPDNHLLDCLVGAAVAAGVQGLKPDATSDGGGAGQGRATQSVPRPKPKLSELQKARRMMA